EGAASEEYLRREASEGGGAQDRAAELGGQRGADARDHPAEQQAFAEAGAEGRPGVRLQRRLAAAGEQVGGDARGQRGEAQTWVEPPGGEGGAGSGGGAGEQPAAVGDARQHAAHRDASVAALVGSAALQPEA